jgi:hypothetical protein
MSPILLRSLATVLVAIAALLALAHFQKKVSLGELLLIGIAAAIASTVIASFARSPAQFLLALYERVRYAVVVPLCLIIMIGLLLFRLFFIIAKLSLKAIIWLVVSAAYFILPIDLIPDFIIGLGQIDDVLLFITLGVWAFGSGLSSAARDTIEVTRPTTPFP